MYVTVGTSCAMKKTHQSFSEKMLNWHAKRGRKHLPWQGKNPYHVWISEIMLQQTQVSKVVVYFENFMNKFPSLKHLAKADISEVLASWSGLGYYNRAKNLHKTAQVCVEIHEAALPLDLKSLMDLPGIGKTTAGAILSLSKNMPYAILDGNVKRVLSRVFAVSDKKLSALEKKLWALTESLVSQTNPKDYNQSLMDLGSMVCKRAKPLCPDCPVSDQCLAYQKNEIALYPQAKNKIRKVDIALHALMIIDGDQVFLQKRDTAGIWPDLWFLPCYDNKQELIDICKELPLTMVAEFSVQHILTHRIFDIRVTYAHGVSTKNIEGHWYERSSLQNVPHPSALTKVLNHFNSHYHDNNVI